MFNNGNEILIEDHYVDEDGIYEVGHTGFATVLLRVLRVLTTLSTVELNVWGSETSGLGRLVLQKVQKRSMKML